MDIFPLFLMFCYYLSCLKLREINRQNNEKLGKCWLCCTRNRAMSNASLLVMLNNISLIIESNLIVHKTFRIRPRHLMHRQLRPVFSGYQ